MKINFLFPGKTKEKFFADGIESYLKRLQPMVEASVVILKGAAASPGRAGEAQAMAREADQVLERIKPGEYFVVMDVKGTAISSPDLAARFEKLMINGHKTVHIAVGGPWGLDQSLIRRADLRLSFGPMTFPHDLARLMLLEQVYRAYAIINNIPYHK